MSRVENGVGRLVITRLGFISVLSHQSYSYPLKIISPRTDAVDHCLTIFLLNYGGGFVSGDVVRVHASIESSACKVAFITQGSTKLFKQQRQHEQSAAQTLEITVAKGCGETVIALLPDPIQPFAQSEFKQVQVVRLSGGSDSLVLLDWFTSGRIAYDHAPWQFTSYESNNQVYVDGRLRLRDAIRLDDGDKAQRMSQYNCYATLIVCGPAFEALQSTLQERFASEERVHKQKQQDQRNIIWSASHMRQFTICKVAGDNTEMVREFLADLVYAQLLPIVGFNALRSLR